MRLVEVRRRRSWTWWGVFLFALLTMSSYIMFDILDVDGSQMTGWPGDDIVVAETPQIEADRFFRGDAFTPDSTGLLYLSLSQCFSTEVRGISPTTTILRIWHSRMLPRVNLHRELACASVPSADPA